MPATTPPPDPDSYASPPCYAHELDFGHFDAPGTDARQALDVARWRKAERQRLRAARLAVPPRAAAPSPPPWRGTSMPGLRRRSARLRGG